MDWGLLRKSFCNPKEIIESSKNFHLVLNYQVND